MKKFILLALIFMGLSVTAQKRPKMHFYKFDNENVMVDMDGQRINCHGGGILKMDSVYYWYGEHRPGFDSKRQKGVSCYSTTDFIRWKNEGIVLSVSEDPDSPLAEGCIIERPKVVYNEKTGKYVLWFHNELPGKGYAAAYSGVAVGDTPTGPFTLLHTGRVNPGIWPMNMAQENKNTWTPEQYEKIYGENGTQQWWTEQFYTDAHNGMFNNRDHHGGQMARDMTVFVDDDGKAYHIYSSEENLTLNIAELNDEYTSHTGRYITLAPAGHNEAPVIFKHKGKYWMICSGCTGWAPNQARYMCADDILGEWTIMEGTPCIGDKAELTFMGQGTYAANIDGQLVFMADIWTPRCLADSRYLWLPILFDDNDIPVIPYVARWD